MVVIENHLSIPLTDFSTTRDFPLFRYFRENLNKNFPQMSSDVEQKMIYEHENN